MGPEFEEDCRVGNVGSTGDSWYNCPGSDTKLEKLAIVEWFTGFMLLGGFCV